MPTHSSTPRRPRRRASAAAALVLLAVAAAALLAAAAKGPLIAAAAASGPAGPAAPATARADVEVHAAFEAPKRSWTRWRRRGRVVSDEVTTAPKESEGQSEGEVPELVDALVDAIAGTSFEVRAAARDIATALTCNERTTSALSTHALSGGGSISDLKFGNWSGAALAVGTASARRALSRFRAGGVAGDAPAGGKLQKREISFNTVMRNRVGKLYGCGGDEQTIATVKKQSLQSSDAGVIIEERDELQGPVLSLFATRVFVTSRIIITPTGQDTSLVNIENSIEFDRSKCKLAFFVKRLDSIVRGIMLGELHRLTGIRLAPIAQGALVL